MSDLTRQQKTQAIIWLDQLAARATAEAARFRNQLSEDARAEYAGQGVAPSWKLPDIATVSTRIETDTVDVADRAAFTAWVAERHPSECETVVRPAFVAAVRRDVVHVGDGTVCNAAGEVIPGLRYRPGGRFLGVSVNSVSRAARQVFSSLADEGLRYAAAVAGPAIAADLVDLVAIETPGHIEPGETA